MFAECPREQDVIDAVTTERWPGRCAADLIAHVASCDGCRDLAATLGPLTESWTEARVGAQVPSAGMVWWRAQMRARQEAAHAASRPVTVAQSIGAVVAVVLAVAGIVLASPWVSSSLAASRAYLALDVPVIAAGWVIAVGAVVALMSLVSVAVYLMVAED